MFFVWSAALDLDRVRPVTGDDAWITSISHKLATQGVLGADLYAGFFRDVLQASACRLFGPGIAVARWVSVASGIALVWAVTLLAMRWYGVAVAVLTGGLMILWRSHVVAMDLGVPLLSVARSARYDLPARLPSAGVEALLDGITREPLRYLRRLEPRLGRWVLLVGIWPALAVLWTRVRGGRDVGDRLVALTLVVPVVLFAFLETTKATLYAFVFWPSICIVAALGVVALAKRALARGTGGGRPLPSSGLA